MAFERLGYHAAPGPYIESAALLPDLVDAGVLGGILDGSAIATAAVPGLAPYALDADSSTHSFLLTPDSLTPAVPGTAPGLH